MTRRAQVGVIGAGAWGTALAQALASDGSDVVIWAREPELVAEINAARSNSLFLPGASLAPTIRATNAIADLAGLPVLLAVVPAQFLGSVLAGLPAGPRDLVLCAKGIEAGSGRLMSDVAADAAPGASLAVLSGPTFAHELAA
jgi:glycerol-3-phosphate dehydrogenase (NAD(P)+)